VIAEAVETYSQEQAKRLDKDCAASTGSLLPSWTKTSPPSTPAADLLGLALALPSPAASRRDLLLHAG
jgi:hypothetical protein